MLGLRRIALSSAALALLACTPEPNAESSDASESGTDSTMGDGDGDPASGDGDGDPASGDGDGDPTAGDGDGDPGDGDGDPTAGDGDGDPTAGDGDGDSEQGPTVLFVGNSYTAVNNLPQLVEALAAGSAMPLNTDSITVGGAWVEDHLENQAVLDALELDWDVIVLQGQSAQPVIAQAAFVDAVAEFALLHDAMRLVLYETWPRAEGNEVLDQLGMSQLEMYEALALGYQLAAEASNAEVARVGTAWMAALALDPAIDLYVGDGSHPSFAGSFLAACMMYGQISNEPCESSDYMPEQLTMDEIANLQLVADITNGFVDPDLGPTPGPSDWTE